MLFRSHARTFVPGSQTYGYALVGQPKNAQTNAYGGGNAAPAWGGQPNAWATGGAPSGWTAPGGTSEPMVDGKTYDQWAASGVTPQAMLTSGFFAAFHDRARAAVGAGQPASGGWTAPAQAGTGTATAGAGVDIPY